MWRRAILGLPIVVGACVAAPEARADDGAVALGTVFTGLAVSDIVFTIYSAIKVDENVEPNSSWMIAQTSVVGLQALFLNGLASGFAAFDKDDGLDLVIFPFATWLGTLSVFSTWSLIDDTGSPDVKGRFGLSTVLALNLFFSGVAVGTLADGRPLPEYMSIPQTALMAPELLLTTIKAVTDPDGRAEWIGLAAWSGALAIHGATSLIVRGIAHEKKAGSKTAMLPFIVTAEGPIPGLTVAGSL